MAEVKSIDLRSDTVTRPTPGMLQAMVNARVGDDVLGDDPTVILLEERVADLLGHEAGLWCPSGTMANQVAIVVHTRPGDELICHPFAHIYNYEGGGIAFNAGVQVRTTGTPDGDMSPAEVLACVNPVQDVYAFTRLLSLENTNNKAGGTVMALDRVQALTQAARSAGLATHLDGARLWNAVVAADQEYRAYGSALDSISVCLSKGLGCPAGSVLTGSRDFIREARRIRKRMGGGLRQVGYLAAAGLYALDHHVSRLAEDHTHARALADIIRQQPWVDAVVEPQTNILIFSLREGLDEQHFLGQMEAHGVRMLTLGHGRLRLVTHLDFKQEDLSLVSEALKRIAF
jgi:threonine aldolase